MRHLAVDPGNTSGWALFDGPTLIDCGTCTYPGACTLHEDCRQTPALGEACLASTWRGVKAAIIEIPQVYPMAQQKGDPNDLIKVAYGAGVYAGRLIAMGAAVKTVKPREWKQQLPKAVCHARSWKKLTPTEQALVTTRLDRLTKKDDLLDAVALGQWALTALQWPV